jgi:hypothetical protein
VSTGFCGYCGSSYDLPGGHTCTPAVQAGGTTLGTGRETAAACNTIAGRLTDADIDRIAERVERRLAERARLRGG